MYVGVYRPPEADGETFDSCFQGKMTDVVEYDYERHFCGAGKFSMAVRLTKENVALLQVGMNLRVDWNDYLTIENSSYGQNGLLTLSGTDMSGILSRRVTLFGDEQTPGSQGYDIVSGTTAECVEHYLNNNMISPSDSIRKMYGMSFKANGVTGLASDSYMSRLENLSTVVDDLCSNAGIGYRVDGGVIKLLEGTDRSLGQSTVTPVVISVPSGNVVSREFSHSVENSLNTIYATGAGITKPVYRSSSTPSGFFRRETAIDVNVQSISEIDQYAIYATRDNIETHSFSFEIAEGQLNKRFWLGDTVTALDDLTGNTFTAVVTAARTVISGTQRRTSITLGQKNPKLLNRIITGIYNGTLKRR